MFIFKSTHLQSRLCLPQQAPSSTFAHPRGYTLARHLAAHHRHPQIICIIVVLKVLPLMCRLSSCVWFVYEKIGQSFCWRRWAEGAGACPSGDNAGLPILGLRHSLRPEWKHGITGLR